MNPPALLPSALPCAAGIGLKPDHYAEVLAAAVEGGHRPAFVEVHPQNYFGAGGPPHRWLAAIAEHYPLSFHSVGLSLGSAAGVDAHELDFLASLCTRYAPAAVSDHLSWSNVPGQFLPELLPVPYNLATLNHFVEQIDRVQSRLGRSMLIENPSRYIALADDAMSEGAFLNALAQMSGCGLLLDLNNIDVSAFNLSQDPAAWLDAIDGTLVAEIHVAGHARKADADGVVVAIDDHGSAVNADCWELLARFVNRWGPRPVLVEWDNAVPEFVVLMGEAMRADEVLEREPVDA
jgi:uncharacterized protein